MSADKKAKIILQVYRNRNNNTLSIGPYTIKGRHDLCIALRAPVVVEAVTAIALADLLIVGNKSI